MNKFCGGCGNQLEDGAAFCNKCGRPGNAQNGVNNTTIINNYNNNIRVTYRNIALAIVFSFLTCGIYGWYWICMMTNDANYVSGENNDTSGGMVIVFSIITCGIYYIYWNYRMGKKLYEAGVRNGVNISDNSIIYLILSLFGLAIVSECLIQNDLNRFS